jgi:hypothetical protein
MVDCGGDTLLYTRLLDSVQENQRLPLHIEVPGGVQIPESQCMILCLIPNLVNQ